MGSISFAQDACTTKLNNRKIISNQCIDFTNKDNLRCTIMSYHFSKLCNYHRWVYYMTNDSTYNNWTWWSYELNTNKVR